MVAVIHNVLQLQLYSMCCKTQHQFLLKNVLKMLGKFFETILIETEFFNKKIFRQNCYIARNKCDLYMDFLQNAKVR